MKSASAKRSRNKPPAHVSNLKMTHTFRFVATGAENPTITSTNIIGALGCMTSVANNTVTPICESFRIKSLSAWAPPPSQGASATVSVEWLGTSQSPAYEVSDTSNSVTSPAFIHSKPPKESNAAFWQSPYLTSVSMFLPIFPAGTIIDLEVELIIKDEASDTFTITVATAVLNTMYYLALDGPSSNNLVPQSLTTTH
jgi:hypothetical protein